MVSPSASAAEPPYALPAGWKGEKSDQEEDWILSREADNLPEKQNFPGRFGEVKKTQNKVSVSEEPPLKVGC